MTEEMKDARKAPKAIIWAVWIGAITGLIFLVVICFCIENIDDAASSPTGVPTFEISSPRPDFSLRQWFSLSKSQSSDSLVWLSSALRAPTALSLSPMMVVSRSPVSLVRSTADSTSQSTQHVSLWPSTWR